MGIDTTVYRARIGSFLQPPYRSSRASGRYCPFTPGTDVHFRTVVLAMLLLSQVLSTYLLLACIDYIQYKSAVSVLPSCELVQESSTYSVLHSITTLQICPISLTLYRSYASRLLLLASDVELNPGPIDDTTQILKAIQDGNERTAAQLQDLKTDLQVLKTDVVSMKDSIGSIKVKLQAVENKQSSFDAGLKKLDNKIDMIDHRTEELESDMSAASLRYESNEGFVGELARQVNLLERDNKKCNLRIFGIPEGDNKTAEVTKRKVVDQVLALTSDSPSAERKDELSGCLEFAKRLGSESGVHPRMILVRFRLPEYKFRLFGFRDVFRSNGVRISNDLTSLERQQLSDLKAQGQKGYIKNGKVVVIKSSESDNRFRKFRRGVRTLQSVRDYPNEPDYASSVSGMETDNMTNDHVPSPID